MTSHDRLTLEEVLAAFDEDLRRTRGVCPGTRRNYARYVGEFLIAVFDDRGAEFGRIASRHGLVESRMRGDTHVRFGGRAGETWRP